MSVKRILVIVMVSALLLAVGIGPSVGQSVRALPEPSADAARETIPYAGRLTDKAGQPVADGAYDLSFALYGTVSGGQSLWSEMQRGVVVSKGEFLTTLGSVAPIPATALNGQNLWLAVSVRGPGEAGFTALAPRQRVSATAPAAGPSCPHDHLGESWIGDSGAQIDGLYVQNTKTGGTGLAGISDTGDGVVGVSGDMNKSGVYGNNTGGGYGVYGRSNSYYGVFSDGPMAVAGTLWVDSHLTVQGYATFSGGKSGYVVDIAQNDDSVSLEAGDIVVISGAGSPVVGEIPVIKVRRTMGGGTSAVVGVVDKHYVLTPKTAAPDRRAEGVFNDAAIAPGEYLSVVTLGAYKAIKVDATYGAIAPGDLLVASPNPGHAMRADSPQPGTAIGKALGELSAGTGVIPVIVTLQ
jgi:hypothetical protein